MEYILNIVGLYGLSFNEFLWVFLALSVSSFFSVDG